jgi:hypothetical protein
MDVASILAIIAIFVSAYSAYVTYEQAKHAKASLRQNEDFSRANVVIHYMEAYQEFVATNDGIPNPMQFNDAKWAGTYWSLHSAEFYFFHHGVIPPEIYTLWMIDVVEMYTADSVWKSHERYLESYEILYPEMRYFFSGVREKSKINNIEDRHHAVKSFIDHWIELNKAQT